jgi:hypothetical protein
MGYAEKTAEVFFLSVFPRIGSAETETLESWRGEAQNCT